MKILVTGLCLSRNLGGPAMGLTLVENLRRRIEGIDFLFAIDPNSYAEEQKWAEYYGLDIVCRDNIVSYLAKSNRLLRMGRSAYALARKRQLATVKAWSPKEVHDEFMAAYASCDVVVDMQGISYVGDGVRGPFEGIISYSNLYYANKHKKPFMHFIQSFGPFDDWKVRFFAKRDFDQMDFVPARGSKSAKYCREIVARPEKVYDFPDSAILLPAADTGWARGYLTKLGLKMKNYVVLSPSAVIYNLHSQVGGSMGEQHVETFALIAEKLLADGESILFVPHMYSANKYECDREVSRKVFKRLQAVKTDLSLCKLVEDDLDVWQAKSLISMARSAIVSRYHALVAAVSTGVPVVTIGWNIKYLDLLEYYGLENMALDIRGATPLQISQNAIDKLALYTTHPNLIEHMATRQKENAAKVNSAFDMLANWLVENA